LKPAVAGINFCVCAKSCLKAENFTLSLAFDNAALLTLSIPATWQKLIFSKSKLTMVNVWATYCNPCLSEMPELGELAGAYEEEEFQVIGIISDVMDTADQKTIDMAKELITQTEADYPHLVLNESVYFALLTDVAVVPTTFFIDENGVVLDTVLGAMNRSGWEEKINELLEKE